LDPPRDRFQDQRAGFKNLTPDTRGKGGGVDVSFAESMANRTDLTRARFYAFGALSIAAFLWLLHEHPIPVAVAQIGTDQERIGAIHDGSHAGEGQTFSFLRMRFAWCPRTDNFKMGSPEWENGRSTDENQVEVTLTKGFWLGKFEVTQRQWSELFDSPEDQPWKNDENTPSRPNLPASYISWAKAKEFCEILSRREREAGRLPRGWEYTLPTEAQWEYACRAGTKTVYSFGEDDSKLGDHAWYEKNSSNQINPVNTRSRNAWNLCDMHGNVWEWCLDYYSPMLKPRVDLFNDVRSNYRVNRGGAFNSQPAECRSANRGYNKSPFDRSYVGRTIGFRVALCREQQETADVAPGEDGTTSGRSRPYEIVAIGSVVAIFIAWMAFRPFSRWLRRKTPSARPKPAAIATSVTSSSLSHPELGSLHRRTPAVAAEGPCPDVVLVTVNENETRAVHEAFVKASGVEGVPVALSGRLYHDLGIVNGTSVYHAISEMGSGGSGGMQQTVEKAISVLKPGAVIAIGIAFGVNEKKQAIGDVLVSKLLRLYDLQRVGKRSRIILRGARPDASPRLVSHFRGFAQTKWDGAPVKIGVLLTGDKLVDNVDYRNQLLKLESEAEGGEMEGAGLYVSSSENKVDWIVIKAICDWADGSKDTDKATRQMLAARNAAEFVVGSLKYAPLRHSDVGKRRDPDRPI
jgi:formylglycine-generating enzyme required for sulfatase activity/nucleoside phosphorylase